MSENSKDYQEEEVICRFFSPEPPHKPICVGKEKAKELFCLVDLTFPPSETKLRTLGLDWIYPGLFYFLNFFNNST